MMSKNSFSANSKENHKRRIWVWIISALTQLLFYPGIMLVYLSRINAWNENGQYRTPEVFHDALKDAAADAVGFVPGAVVPLTLLAVLIAVQGFSYLYDRKKVDMYQSVPVPYKRRFAIIYTNGVLIYAIPAIAALAAAVLIALPQGAVDGKVLAECALGFIGNLLYFLVVYHTALLAVMLTGNIVITGFATAIFLFIVYVIAWLYHIMNGMFFERADFFFSDNTMDKYSICTSYLIQINELKRMKSLAVIVPEALRLYGGWLLAAVVIFAIAYFAYVKRPAESAGTAVAFPVIKPYVKIIISVIAGLLAYWLVQDATYENMAVSLFAMIAATIICCGVMESFYAFDIRAAVKHLVSTGIAAACAVLLFCVYFFDIFGYDAYVPDADKVESAAVNIGPYQRYWVWSEEDESMIYSSASQYIKENMFLTDVEAVCELARKGQEMDTEYFENNKETDARIVNVVYRLKSGREVARCFYVNLADKSSEELLNRVIGTKEYREGYYQFINNELPYERMTRDMSLYYTNGALECSLPPAEVQALRDAWVKDMEQFDYSMARNNRICGMIEWGLYNRYSDWELPVYESFTNTIAFLKEHNAYAPVTLRAQDIEKLEITNYHYNETEETYDNDMSVATAQAHPVGSRDLDSGDVTVTIYYEDTEDIEKIVDALYPQDFETYWNERGTIDDNYDVVVTFKPDAEYPYGRGYYYYEFLSGQVPDFVVQATAYQAD
ncbi:MAG: hypothetical protein NC321_11715 [Clostridium sp.]|nr:hypothetical protein [Clostridium sp.]